MTGDEKLAILARAILDVAAKAATTWDYDGDQQTATGVNIEWKLEEALQEIAKADAQSV